MTTPLKEQFTACREAIRIAIFDALKECEQYIASIERTARGDSCVSGIALELFPWHGSLGLSLRLTSDFPLGGFRYDSADWIHYNFTNDCKSPSIDAAIALVTQIYHSGKESGDTLCEMAHLTFMAGAEALLAPQVSGLLNQFGIGAPLITDTFISSPFQYIVMDVDQTVKSNYCDIVLANRITRRLLTNAE